MPLTPEYHETRQDHERQLIREHEAQPRESALGDGCCGQCGEPAGMVRLKDGTDALGCKCHATPEQLRAEIKRLTEKIDGIPPCFFAGDRPTDEKG